MVYGTANYSISQCLIVIDLCSSLLRIFLLWLIKGIVVQAEAKYYCVDELVVGTEQSLGKLGVEVNLFSKSLQF